MKKVLLFSASILAITVSPSYAQNAKTAKTDKAVVAEKNISESAAAQNNQVFKLGEISVSVADQSVSNVGNLNTVTAEEIQAYTDSDTLDKAVALLPGVDLTYQIGAKNQKGVSIRGFTTRQISVMVDGVSQALPYDNDPDMQRYLTNDLSEIQVAKGISSVLNGPNTLGGVINLVTKRPTKEIEGNLTVKAKFDVDGKYNGIQNSFNVGTNQGDWYLQTGGTYNDIDHWKVSRDYTPVPGGDEDGGYRENSDSKDYKFNFKLGYTPNETDEYVIAYNYQHAVMGVPYHYDIHSSTPSKRQYRRFDPYDHWGISTMTNTAVGDTGYVKTRLFYDQYQNHLWIWNSPAFTTLTFGSVDDYQDYAFGGNIEGGFDLNSYNTIKSAFHYRRDVHTKGTLYTDNAWEREKDDTYSIALEDTIHLTKATDLIVGASYDWLDSARPKNNTKVPVSMQYRKDDDTFNPMMALRHKYSETGTIFGGVAKKSRFATQKERFSTRQNTYDVNPLLKAETAINYEIGFNDTLANKLKVESNVFYNDIDDALMAINSTVLGSTKKQVANVGKARSYGLELAAGYQFTDDISVGMGYTYLRKKLRGNPLLSVLTNVPKHKLNLYADVGIMEGLSVVPVITAYSSRYSPKNGAPAESGALAPGDAVRTSGFMTADLK
ncbi:MAG: TonB-dependent receptor plug domain-containing protein, partial [Alphaproteobacteria bacterium]